MIFAAHRSDGLISRIIAWFRPPYNHIEMWFDGQVVISADADGVVQKSAPVLTGIGRGTIIDFFAYKEPLTDIEEADAWRFASSYVGYPYDYWELFWGFTKKGPSPAKSRRKLICSGVTLAVTQGIQRGSTRQRVLLNRVRQDRAAPRDLTRSPLLKWIGSKVVSDE